jgi:hypothetical protein
MSRGIARKYGIAARAALVLLLAVGAAACGDDDDPTDVNALDAELVVGTYDPTTLTFDVAGQTFGEYDLLAGFQTDEIPPLLVISTDGAAQLVFLDPVTNQFRIGDGTYTMLEDGVRIAFDNASEPLTMLLPQTLDLTYDATTGVLDYSSDIQAPLTRLVELVPELDGEPLSDPVGGVLTVEFTPR